jgi:tetratricopeptide (TPR) repeat protein
MFKRKQSKPGDNLERKTLYEILGVDKNDPSGIIHKSFHEQLPKYTPQREKENLIAIYTAFHILFDPESRRRYDTLITAGDDIRDLMNQTYAAFIQGNYKASEIILRKVVNLTNRSPESLILLAELQYEQNKYRTSINTLKELVDLYPNKPFYRNHLGNVLFALSREMDDESKKKELLNESIAEFRKSLEIDNTDMDVYNALTMVYITDGQYDAAYIVTEEAVDVRKLDSFRNFDPLLYGCMALAAKKDSEKLHEQIMKLEDSVPQDDDAARNYAVDRILDVSMFMIKIGNNEDARSMAYSARRLKPDSRIVRIYIDGIDMIITLTPAINKIEQDNLVIKPVREFLLMLYRCYYLKPSEEEVDLIREKIEYALTKFSLDDVKKSLERVYDKYPELWNLAPRSMENLLKNVMNISQTGTPVAGLGWRLLLMLILGAILISHRLTCGYK